MSHRRILDLRRLRSVAAPAVLSWLAGAASCPAQNLLFCPTTGLPGAGAGAAVNGIGDVDRDSISDVAIGAPNDSVPGPSRGAVYVCSGRDGALLYTVRGDRDNDRLGLSVSPIGDLDRDGIDDLLVGAPYGLNQAGVNTGYARAHSGADGRLLRRFEGVQASDYFGTSVAGVGDVNGDGVPDLAVGAPESAPIWPIRFGYAVVFSGADGSVLHRFAGAIAYDDVGRAVSGIGDIDSDGRADVLVAWARSASPNVPKVVAYSGRTGARLIEIHDTAARSGFGTSLAPLGDVNGDGVADFAAGAPIASRVEVYSVDGRRLWGFATGAFTDRLGSSVCRIGDLDGDGRDDVAAGAPASQASGASGRVLLISGRTGTSLHTLAAGAAGDAYGTSVGTVRDLDADGRADLIVGAPGLTLSGQACLYARLEARFETYGAGCGGATGAPRLSASGPPRLGQQFTLTIDRLVPLRVGIVLFGSSDRSWSGISLPADLTGWGMPGCQLLASAERMLDISTQLGATRLDVFVPNERTLLRLRLFHQCLSLDEGANALGVATSNGAASVVGL